MTQQFGFNSPVPPVVPAAAVDGTDDLDREDLDRDGRDRNGLDVEDPTLDESRLADRDSVDADRDASYHDGPARGVDEPREDEPTIIKSPDLM